MVQRLLIILISFYLALFTFTEHANAAAINPQDQLVADCFDNASHWSGILWSTETYVTNVHKCLSELSANHSSWECNIIRDDFGNQEPDIQACTLEYTNSICTELERRKKDDWSFQDYMNSCEKKRTDFNILFTTQNTFSKLSPTPTATPTPTPRADSAYSGDICIQRLKAGEFKGANNECLDVVEGLIDCYKNNIPGTDKLWACASINNTIEVNEQICSRSFKGYVRGELLNLPISNNESNNIRCNSLGAELTEENVDSIVDRAIGSVPTNELNTPGKTLEQTYIDKLAERTVPGVTPTPGVIDSQYLDAVERTEQDEGAIQEAYDILSCGFAGTKKNACCTNTPIDLDPTKTSDDDIVAPEACGFWKGLVGLCDGLDLSDLAKNKFKEYIDENEVTTSLNAIIEEQGAIPKCFVGTCNTNNECEVDGTAKICQKYIGQAENPIAYASCVRCMETNGVLTKKFYTGLGCIDTSFEGIITTLFTLGLGIAGTVALFCVIYAAFMMQTSQNNPERIQKAQENMTSCITGLILIIFSIFILRVIGVDILRIPGFNGSSNTQQVTPNNNKSQNPI